MNINSEKKKSFILIFLAFLLIPSVVYGDMIWPSIYIIERMNSIPIIISGYFIEVLFVKHFMKESWVKSFIISFIMNAISCTLGALAIAYTDFFAELMISGIGNTFDLFHWIIDGILAVIVNIFIEGLTLKWIFKRNLKETYKWITVANIISVFICLIIPFQSNLF